MNEPRMSDHRHFEMARVSDRRVVQFPHYGYLEGFEVRLHVPQQNMNTGAAPWLAFIDLIGPDCSKPEFEVVGMFRSVQTGEL